MLHLFTFDAFLVSFSLSQPITGVTFFCAFWLNTQEYSFAQKIFKYSIHVYLFWSVVSSVLNNV